MLLQPAVLVMLIATAVLALPVGRWLAQRYRCPRSVAVGFVVACGVVVSLTAVTGPMVGHPFPERWWIPYYLRQLTDDGFLYAELTSLCGNAEELANVLLFLPVGFLGCLLWRSALRTVAFAACFTVAVETWQSIIGRASSLGDLLHNAIGGTVGALLALGVRSLMRRRRGGERHQPGSVRATR
ncbi:MAG TPA: VanZ family protein [Micromonospora sp.]